MRRRVLIILAVLFLAILWYFPVTVGDSWPRVDVIVDVIDRETGERLSGAVVATVEYPQRLLWDWFDEDLAKAVRMQPEWAKEPRFFALSVYATTTDGVGPTRFASGGQYASWENIFGVWSRRDRPWVPEVLLIDHPRYGRTLILIEQDRDPVSIHGNHHWQLDLGTIHIPNPDRDTITLDQIER